jgi:DNA topoisomerase-1
MSAVDDDAKVGPCPDCGEMLMFKFSPKNKSSFVGCSGYPECSRTYPLPKNTKFEAVEEMCPVCGSPQVKLIKFKQRPSNMCLNTDCASKKGPEMIVGVCPICGGDLWQIYSQFGKRYVRCEKVLLGECKAMYPLPQSGDIDFLEELCPQCGAPRITTVTKKGPWTRCISPECPSNPPKKTWGKAGTKKSPAKSGARAKPGAKRKTAAKKKAADA